MRSNADVIHGARLIGPAALGTFFWGVAAGVAMIKGGMSPMQAILMTVVVFSGTAQLAALPLMIEGAALPVIWLTAALANLRFVLYSAITANEFRRVPLLRRLTLGWLTTDTGIATYLAHRQQRAMPVRQRARLFAGANGLTYAAWISGTVMGVLLAGRLPDQPQLAFAGVLAIIALVGAMLRDAPAWANAAVAGTVAVLAAEWPLRSGLFLAIAAGALVATFMTRPARVHHAA
ncbi:MAG: AzlC family ABC transporter permease [Burkholderiaceae bacterium]